MQNLILKSIESYLGYSFQDFQLQHHDCPNEVHSNKTLLNILEHSFKTRTNTVLYLNTDDCLAQVHNIYNYPGEDLHEEIELADIILTDNTSPAYMAHTLYILMD